MPRQMPFALTPKFSFTQALVMGLMMGTLALPSTTQAAPTLTVYGIVDLGMYYHQVARDTNPLGAAINESQTGMVSGVLSGSRWGIKGTEQISPEWSANFVFESGINAQDGTLAQGGLAFGRQATLSLSNQQYGSLTFGRRGALSYTYLVPMDPFSISGSQAGLGASFGSANGVRPNNLLLYQTSALGGWQAGIGYSLNTGFTALYASNPTSKPQPASDQFGTSVNMRLLTAGINYSQGPTSFFVAYDAVYGADEVITDAGQTQPNSNKAVPRAWVAGGYHDFKFLKLSAAIGQTFDGMFFGQNAGAGGYNSPLINFSDGANVLFAEGARSLQYALGAILRTGEQSKFLLSWQVLQPQGTLKASDQLATQRIYSAAYVYSFSKRTDIYV